MPPETAYEVGYKKPPKNSQFQKGQSGNPRGRPRREKNNSARVLFNDALDEKVMIVENGRRCKVTKCEAMFKHLANRAAQGDARATQTVLRFAAVLYRISQHKGSSVSKSPPNVGAVVMRPHNNRDPLDPELIAAYARVKAEIDAKRLREGRGRDPANDDEKEEVA